MEDNPEPSARKSEGATTRGNPYGQAAGSAWVEEIQQEIVLSAWKHAAASGEAGG